MTRQAYARAIDGYQLTLPRVETYLYTAANVLTATNDPGLKELANELTSAYLDFTAKVHNTLQEANQYLDVIHAERMG